MNRLWLVSLLLLGGCMSTKKHDKLMAEAASQAVETTKMALGEAQELCKMESDFNTQVARSFIIEQCNEALVGQEEKWTFGLCTEDKKNKDRIAELTNSKPQYFPGCMNALRVLKEKYPQLFKQKENKKNKGGNKGSKDDLESGKGTSRKG